MTTVQEITSQLTSGMSVDDIRAFVNTWDMDVGGGTLLLYSGGAGQNIGDGQLQFNTRDIAQELASKSPDLKTIQDTGIQALFDDPTFLNALDNAIANDPLYQGRDVNQVLDGLNSDGSRIGDGFWDDASRNLVNQHTGDYRLIMPELPDGSVAAATEIPALLEKNIDLGQKINGIDLQDWQERYDAEKLLHGETIAKGEIDDLIRTISKADLANANIGFDANNDLWISTDGDLGKKLGLDPHPLPEGVDGTRLSSLADLGINADGLAKLAKYGDLLNKAGVVGDVLGTAIAVGQSIAAINDGHPEQAGAIMANLVGNIAGGFAVGTAAGALMGGIAAAVGAPVLGAMALVGAAGVAGGYLGGESVGKELEDLYHDLSGLGVLPFLGGLLDDYKWAFDNPSPVLGQLPPWIAAPIGFLAGVPVVDPNRPMQGLGHTDPLVIDLDNDGVELTSAAASGVRYDFWGDGFAGATGWVGADDGFLVRDVDANGKIEGVSEMFGSPHSLDYIMGTDWESFLNNENGFAQLALLDSNADGKVSAADAAWGTLQVWQDTNQDGVSQASELHTLSSLGIASIGVNNYELEEWNGLANGGFGRVIEGNTVTHTGTVTMTDASTREIVPRREARSEAERVRQLLLEPSLIYRADGAAIVHAVANDNRCLPIEFQCHQESFSCAA